jgi:hypothetical protein
MRERCKSLSPQNVQCGLPEGHWGSHTNYTHGYRISWQTEDKDKEKFYRGDTSSLPFPSEVDEPASETSYKTLWGEEKKK